MSKFIYAYALLLAAAALLVGGLVGRFWVVDAVLLTVIAIVVVVDCARRIRSRTLLEGEEPIVRSRVVHYARISKVADNKWLEGLSDNPFELEVVSRRGWPSLSPEELERIGSGRSKTEAEE